MHRMVHMHGVIALCKKTAIMIDTVVEDLFNSLSMFNFLFFFMIKLVITYFLFLFMIKLVKKAYTN